MRRPLSLILVAAAAVAAVVLMPATAYAMTVRQGDTVLVSEHVPDDLYVFGSNVAVTGDVDGDVVAFGQSVEISGRVGGGVIAAAQTVRVSGDVTGSVRAAASDVEIASAVGGDVVLAGNTVRVARSGSVGRDAAVAAQTVALAGSVGRNVLAAAESLQVLSSVGGDVSAEVNRLTVAEGAQVRGNLTYRSERRADIRGRVGGQTRHLPPRPRRQATAAQRFFLALLSWVRGLVGILLFGALFMVVTRYFPVGAAGALWRRPWQSFGIGTALVLGVVPAAVLTFVLGLLVGGWWIAFVVLAVVWLLSLGGIVVGSLAVGWLILSRLRPGVAPHPFAAMLLGLVVVWVVGAVPFVGWLAGLAAMLLGTGAIVLALYDRPRRPLAAPVVTPPVPSPAGVSTEPSPPEPPQA